MKPHSDSSFPVVHVRVTIDELPGAIIELEAVPLEKLVGDLLAELLQRFGLPPDEEWGLRLGEQFLDNESALEDCLSPRSTVVHLVLAQEDEDDSELDGLDWEVLQSELGLDDSEIVLEGSDYELRLHDQEIVGHSDYEITVRSNDLPLDAVKDSYDEDDEDLDDMRTREAMPSLAPSSGRMRRVSGSRRATVRYYNRMNPDRVHPFLVVISRDMIEQVVKRNVEQRTSQKFQADLSAPIEIEPVLPGCDCYPPRIAAKLTSGLDTFTFRVVPHVLGWVDGAAVTIRQHHVLLTEVPLKIKVVQRNIVLASGAMTFLMPALSAVMKRFNLDFETQKEQDFSLYLRLAQILFDEFSPALLTGVLAGLTIFLWWWTRPTVRDVFHDITPLPASPSDV